MKSFSASYNINITFFLDISKTSFYNIIMNKTRSIINIIFILISNVHLSAVNVNFLSYEVENGLSSNRTSCCTQDSYGYIWIGTRDGLNKFDGYTFEIFRRQENDTTSLLSNWITTISLNSDSILHIGTNKGIQKFDYSNKTFHTIPAFNDILCKKVLFDSQNHLFALTDKGHLLEYDEITKELISINPPNMEIQTFDISDQDKIYAASNNNDLFIYDIKKESFELIRNHSIKNITIVKIDSKNQRLIIGTTSKAYIFDLKKQEPTCILDNQTQRNHDERLDIRDITILNNTIWFSTFNGIYIYNSWTHSLKRLTHSVFDNSSLSSNAIKQITIDMDNGIWICNDNNGINYGAPYRPFRYIKDTGENNFKGNIIHDIHISQDSIIYIGTEDKGLNEISNIEKNILFKHWDNNHGLSQNSIHGLTSTKDAVWVGTINKGIDVINKKDGKIIKHYDLKGNTQKYKNDDIVCLYQTKDNTIYAGTSYGLYQYDRKLDQFTYLSNMPNSRIQCLLEDHSGTLWIATFGAGVYYCKKNSEYAERLNTKNLFSFGHEKAVNSIFEDSNNNIWFATGSGLYKLNPATMEFKSYTTTNGLPSNVTFRIEEDDRNRLWISSSNGLILFIPENDSIAAIFKHEHGLISNHFNYNSSARDNKGNFYFGTIKGLVYFNANTIETSSIKPKIYIDKIKFTQSETNDNSEMNVFMQDKLTLKHDQSSFSINYCALNYQGAQYTKYAWKMEGISDKWNYVIGETKAYFTQLTPGKYVFKIKAANISGIWSEEPATISITILPPWWRSTLAYAIYFTICAIFIFFSIHKYHRINKRKIGQELKEIENKKEKELFESKINFFTNIAHEIRTPLTLIKVPFDKIKNEIDSNDKNYKYFHTIENNINRLLELINQLLDFRKAEKDRYQLNFTQVNIIETLNKICDRFRNSAESSQLRMNIDTSNAKANLIPALLYLDKEAFTKITSNLLSNAIKYAQSNIDISIYLSDNQKFIIVDISNDGELIAKEDQHRIFEPFFRRNEAKPGTGIGLPLARSLAEMHNGSLVLLPDTDKVIFRLTLPVIISLNNSTNDTKVLDIKTSASLIQQYSFDENRCTILIVEDNPELLSLLGEELNHRYNIITATNGQQAIEQVNKSNIQLIISDIMMPIMDGFELIRKLKSNPETSHIPVILLTAKNTLQTKLEGLELGADAYIEKPFEFDLLSKQINNLLDNRNHLRSFYFKSPIANLKSITHSKNEEIFMNKLSEVIEQNISNTKLDVDFIAEKMNLSRASLYRKINNISKLSPNELIKIARLKKAAELILQGELRLNEISEAVGFSSQSYFSRAFLKQFNRTPSQFAKEHKKNDNPDK